MTLLDWLLILIGLSIITLAATQGMIRVLIMFFAFYLVSITAGMATLAADIIQDLAKTVTSALGASPPPLSMAQIFVFVGLAIPLFIGTYFLSRLAFADTSIPELRGFDNIFGTGVGIILALLVMAVVCNTWGVAVNVRRQSTPMWQSMKTAYYYSTLKPYMLQIIDAYRMLLFVFNFIEYPVFFIPQY